MNSFKKDVKELIELYDNTESFELNNYMDFLYDSYVANLKKLFQIKLQLIVLIAMYVLSLGDEAEMISLFGVKFNLKISLLIILPPIFTYVLYQYASLRLIKTHLMYIFSKVGEKLKRPEYKQGLNYFSIPFNIGLYEEIYRKNYNKKNKMTVILNRTLEIIVLAFIFVPILVYANLIWTLNGLELIITILSILVTLGYFIGILINENNSQVKAKE